MMKTEVQDILKEFIISKMDKERAEKMALISKLDYEMTKEILNGHRSVIGDKFQDHRDKLLELRKELFPDSIWALGTKQN